MASLGWMLNLGFAGGGVPAPLPTGSRLIQMRRRGMRAFLPPLAAACVYELLRSLERAWR